MKKTIPTIIATLIWATLNSHAYANNDLQRSCYISLPSYNKPLVQGNNTQLPISIQADKFEGKNQESGIYENNVHIQQGNREAFANKAEIEQQPSPDPKSPNHIVILSGHVFYKDPNIQLTTPKATLNLSNHNTDVEQSQYQFVGRQGRGYSKHTQLKDNRYTIIENGSFTTCLPNNDSWSIQGTTITHDKKEQLAEIWNAVFKVGPIPIFYSPYLQFPTSNQRRSGFLRPIFSYSYKNGLEYSQPYYWNIAPNFDATLTPHNIGHRGLLLENEFRYLLPFGSGAVAFDWLNNDRLYKKESPSRSNLNHPNNDRWLFYWNHSGIINTYWHFNVDFTKVSDPYYFTDITSKYGSTTDGYVTQKYSIGYSNDNWSSSLATKQFQIFDRGQTSNVYRAEPQLDINYYKNDLGLFDFHSYFQVARFTSPDRNNPSATRIHFEPTLSLPLSNQWGSINTEAKLFATHYNQTLPSSYDNQIGLKRSINRIIPQFKIDGKMILEKDSKLFSGYTQTLEPRIQYLYTAYRDQHDINKYDSTLLQNDYYGLFRTRSYSGIDRIASANQLTTGITTRYYDTNESERFNLSLGQIYYFHPVQTGEAITSNQKNTGTLSWTANAYYKIQDNLAFRSAFQYDARLKNVSLANSAIEYHKDDDRFIQLSYRYASEDYILSSLQKDYDPLGQNISQVGIVASWPLTYNMAAVGTYYYDTKLNLTNDAFVGLRYNTCCWAVSVIYGRKIVGIDAASKESDYDHKLSFGFELRGFGTNDDLGTRKILTSTGIIPYEPAF